MPVTPLEVGERTLPLHGESLILRWEITDPMKVGDVGVVRFKCRGR